VGGGDNMRSSYIENNYGEVFEAIVDSLHPLLVVELGVLDGYSLLHLAQGIKKANCTNSHIDAYDLFEGYSYKHGTKEEVQRKVDEQGYSELISLYKEDAFKVSEKYQNGTVHLLHVDISNTGETIKEIMSQWDNKIVHGGQILFEGGSEERDNVEWMIKYNKKPIKPEIESNPIINSKYVYGTYLKFPSLTVLLKKR
jgi:hypothetical protein